MMAYRFAELICPNMALAAEFAAKAAARSGGTFEED
jgi:hypothetical protein